MLGVIAGDIIGSAFEFSPVKTTNFPLFDYSSHFTDDTILTVAVADAILNDGKYASYIKKYGRQYPHASYGTMFKTWFAGKNSAPYNSFGNGSAMRVGPVGFAFNTLEEVLAEAKASAVVTHNHPEGIKGAQATAAAIFLARTGHGKAEIRSYIEDELGYNLSETLDDIRPGYSFDVTCQGSVPQSIIAFLESEDYEDAVRKAVSLGGDADTMACIAGGIAEAFYKKIPQHIIIEVRRILDRQLMETVNTFYEKFMPFGHR
ncbi:MAG: ADP-ribosylglycohydrolase family protein [Dehalococcoidales bacterium]|nr:ADP-ribosylglycohydrolase family protein [Dehalococcoidales bacterium]